MVVDVDGHCLLDSFRLLVPVLAKRRRATEVKKRAARRGAAKLAHIGDRAPLRQSPCTCRNRACRETTQQAAWCCSPRRRTAWATRSLQ